MSLEEYLRRQEQNIKNATEKGVKNTKEAWKDTKEATKEGVDTVKDALNG